MALSELLAGLSSGGHERALEWADKLGSAPTQSRDANIDYAMVVDQALARGMRIPAFASMLGRQVRGPLAGDFFPMP